MTYAYLVFLHSDGNVQGVHRLPTAEDLTPIILKYTNPQVSTEAILVPVGSPTVYLMRYKDNGRWALYHEAARMFEDALLEQIMTEQAAKKASLN